MKIAGTERNIAVLERFCFALNIKISAVWDKEQRISEAGKVVTIYEAAMKSANSKTDIELDPDSVSFIKQWLSRSFIMLRNDDKNLLNALTNE
jgi:hypothetical protein